MTRSGGSSRPITPTDGLKPDGRAAAPSQASGPGSADYASRLLWLAGLMAAALSLAAFVLWTRNGAGILLDMILALCL